MYLLLLCRIHEIGRKQARLITLHAQLGLPNKGCAINGLVVCYVVWLIAIIYGMGLWTSAWVWSLVVVRMTIKLKYPNTP